MTTQTPGCGSTTDARKRQREAEREPSGVDALAELIWTASRADEGTISATGADHLAAVIRDWLLSDETVERAAHALFADEQCDSRQRQNVTEQWETRLSVADCLEYRALARAALAAAVEGRQG